MFKGLVHSRYKVRVVLFVVMLLALLLSMFVETTVMNNNSAIGLYTTEEEFDEVRIPMMMGGLLQLKAAFFFALSLAIPRKKYWAWVSLCVALLPLYLTVGTMGYWLKPNHFAIAIGYIPSSVVVLMWMLNVWVVSQQRSADQHHKEEVTHKE